MPVGLGREPGPHPGAGEGVERQQAGQLQRRAPGPVGCMAQGEVPEGVAGGGEAAGRRGAASPPRTVQDDQPHQDQEGHEQQAAQHALNIGAGARGAPRLAPKCLSP